MNQGRTFKIIFGSKPEGSRRRGRSRMKWLEDIEKDQWEKVKRWRLKVVNRKNGCPSVRRPRLSEGRRANE
jgi:hypothetical protein